MRFGPRRSPTRVTWFGLRGDACMAGSQFLHSSTTIAPRCSRSPCCCSSPSASAGSPWSFWSAMAASSRCIRLALAGLRCRRPTTPAARGPDRDPDADLQRGPGARSSPAAGDLRVCRGQGRIGERFDFFMLSDTTEPDAWVAEERAWSALLRAASARAAQVFYRAPRAQHRTQGRQHRRLRARAGAAPTTTCWCSTPTA